MFTQTNRFNTNKCNGCQRHCTIDAIFYDKHTQGFLPTINGKTIKYYIDKNGTKHSLRLYNTRYNAIDAARSITKSCEHFTEKFSTATSSTPNTCTGCNKLCKFGAKQDINGFLPTINNQTIHGYIDAHGTLQVIQPKKKIIQAIIFARRVAERCDFYKKHKTKEETCHNK